MKAKVKSERIGTKRINSFTFFKSLGWKYISVGSYEWDWVKLDGRGQVIAHLGDQIWVNDHRKWTAKKKSNAIQK